MRSVQQFTVDQYLHVQMNFAKIGFPKSKNVIGLPSKAIKFYVEGHIFYPFCRPKILRCGLQFAHPLYGPPISLMNYFYKSILLFFLTLKPVFMKVNFLKTFVSFVSGCFHRIFPLLSLSF